MLLLHIIKYAECIYVFFSSLFCFFPPHCRSFVNEIACNSKSQKHCEKRWWESEFETVFFSSFVFSDRTNSVFIFQLNFFVIVVDDSFSVSVGFSSVVNNYLRSYWLFLRFIFNSLLVFYSFDNERYELLLMFLNDALPFHQVEERRHIKCRLFKYFKMTNIRREKKRILEYTQHSTKMDFTVRIISDRFDCHYYGYRLISLLFSFRLLCSTL